MKRRLHIPIRLRFMLTFLVLVTGVVGLITFSTASLFQDDKQGYVNGLTSMVGVAMAEEAHTTLAGYGERLRLYGKIIRADAMSDDNREKMSQIVFAEFPELLAVVIQPEGREPMGVYNAGVLEEARVIPSDLLDFETQNPLPRDKMADGRPYVRNSTFTDKLPSFTLAFEQVLAEDGEPTLLYGVMLLSKLQQLTTRFSAYDQFLVGSDGVLLVHRDPARIAAREVAQLEPEARQVQGQHSAGITLEFEDAGTNWIGGYASVDYGGVIAAAKIPSSAAHLASQRLVNRLLTVAALLLMIAIVVGTVWAHRITRPMETLTEATRTIAKGNFDIQVEMETRDEIGVLANSFNQMTSELKQREEELTTAHNQLVQSEKMAAFGQLGAGIAHEIKNPLTGILACAEIAASEVGEASSVQEELKLIQKESKRCRTIIDNLLKFARQEKAHLQSTEINNVVNDALAIVNHQLAINEVALKVELDEQVPLINANGNQLQQVFINLAINAQQAMEGNRGSLHVTTGTNASGQVEVRFADTGPGIPEDIQKKLFDPFFTTKPVGKGTGLGLSVSYGIIQDHGGQINVESELGKGTTFVIQFPPREVAVPSAADRPAQEPVLVG